MNPNETKAEDSLAGKHAAEESKLGESADDRSSKSQPLARLIAFYLPQFHPIEENDRWWGKGFTEWTNVAQVTPRFGGHHQPQIPGELGFYDLRLAETRIAQADLARAHGIEAFCYWHYWFNGRRILQRPFEEALASGRPDFGFCLAWANENWTRRWDGQENEILLKQTYGGEEDDRAHFASLLTAFRDPRAFRIDGKPVFLIYRPANLPDARRTIELWRELAREAGLPGLYFIAVITCFAAPGPSPTQMGFDSELHFQPDFSPEMMRSGIVLEGTADRVVQYADVWPLMSRAARNATGRETFGCVTPSWDNCARRKREALIIHNSTPGEYGRWLRQEIARVQDRAEQHRVVFINAWNEWAEGNHLEPDLKWGRAYLEETLRATEGSPSVEETGEIATAAHSDPPPEEESTESLLGRAESLRQQSKWPEAGAIYQILTGRLPDDLSVWRGRIECARKLRHRVLTNLLIQDAVRSHPEWAAELKAPGPSEGRPAAVPEDKIKAPQTSAVSLSTSARMKREWNARAAENARYFVRSTTRDQTEEDFDASGRENVNQCVITDLPQIAGQRDPKSMAMLEIGCGLGRMTKHFAGLFGHVHAIDVSGEMIRQARERLKALSNVSLDETSGDNLSFLADETIDFVFSFIVFQHIPDRAVVINYIREAHRVLRPGGVFKFQVQGCTEKRWMEAPKDTWHGVTITEEDITRLRGELGFDLLAKSGQGTQYSWYTLRKPARKAAPLRDSANPPAPPPDASAKAECCAANGNEAKTTGASPAVSVIIPVLNNIELTRKCLKALRQNTPAELCEVIIWDNASTDATQTYFQRQPASNAAVRYFRSEENLGFVGGNNAAAQHALGRCLVFLNNDTEPQAGWLEALLQTIEADPAIAAVGAKLIYPNGQLQEAGGIIFRDASGWNYGRTQDPRDPRFNFPREVDYCSAACLLVRSDLFRQLGGFDSRYAPAYYEDTDLCFALRQAGYKIFYQPRCEIIHHEGATAGQDLSKGFKQYQVANRQKFFDKWQKVLAQQPAPDPGLVRRASHRVTGQRILIIDPILPMYDRASGSRRLFEMLKLLADGGNAVTFIARNGYDGERYAAELERLGVEVYSGDAERMKECGFTVNCRPLDLKKLLQDSQYDTIILSFWYMAEQYLPRIRAWSPTSRVLIDTVDVHFLRERREAELHHDEKLLQQAEKTRQGEMGIYRQADALITVTEDDRQTLLRELPQSRIFVVPNIHDLAGDTPPVNNRDGLLFVGNFCHRPNEDAVLYFHREIWPRILQRVPGARWTIVGNNPTPAVQALAGAAIQVTGYVPSVEPYLRSHLISIAPLRYGAGMKGKIGEALAHGLPVVTSSIGAEGMTLTSGHGGTLVADDPETFAAHVARLCADHELWNELSAQGRRHIQSHFTPECIGRNLKMLLDWSASLTSIIVLAHNQLRDTQQCVASIEKYTPVPHELILVDNGSTDGTAAFFRQYAARRSNVRVIFNRANLGFAAGNNQALACAQGDAVLFLNNDTVVTSGWLERMRAVLDSDPDCGLVGPVSNSVSGPQQVTSPAYSSLDQLPQFAAQWSASHAGQSVEAARLVGFCLLARRAVTEKIGGLDPQFGSGNFEDDDFCIRAGLAGFKLRIAFDSFVHHTGGQTFKGAKIDYRAAMLRNWNLFKKKWGFPKDAPLEKGYPLPSALPPGASLQIPLPNLNQSHAFSPEARCWTDKTLPETGLKKSSPKPAAPIQLPPCALAGYLGEALELLRKKQSSAAWTAVLAAISARPYHPEAYLLLAEIAQTAGDAGSARACAKAAREMAPDWAAPKQFLKGNLRGSSKPEWLKLPPALCDHNAAAAPRLSVCLIAKNEERFLPQCLRSIRSVASQIVLVDTGSTDRTVEIAREHGAQIHHFAWCDDFSAARNAALEHATGDWVLILDADEELRPEQVEVLRQEIQRAGALGYRLPIVNQGQEQEGCSYVPRLFRNAPGLFFVGRIHEQVFSSILVRCGQWGLKNLLGKTTLLHHGYTAEVVASRNKVERNLRLLERATEEMPDEPHLIMNLGLELARSGQAEAGLDRYWEAFRLMAAAPASRVTPESRETLLTQLSSHLLAAQRFSEVVELWQHPFAKSGGLTASQHFALGLAHQQLKQFSQAAEQMRQCLAKRSRPALSPIFPEILKAAPSHCLACCLVALNDFPAARQAFEAALKDDPSSRVARFDLARFEAAQGHLLEAREILNLLVAENPQELQVWQFGGQIALSRPEDLQLACHWTGQAIQHFPQDRAILLQRAEALMLNQEIEEALSLWRAALAPATPSQRAALVLCELLTGQNNYQFPATDEPAISRDAIRWYRQWIHVNAYSTVHLVHERIETIRLKLPTFVRTWEKATQQAHAAAV